MARGCDPRVSVVVLTRDRAAELIRTLERLQRLPERPRLIVVDNGSRDGTALRMARRFPSHRRVLPTTDRAGPPAAELQRRRAGL